MNLDKYRHQHADIIGHVRTLRQLSAAGIAEQASAIAREVIAMSAVIKLHLSVEDRFLYPAMQQADAALAQKARQYQQEMTGIATQYAQFSRQWNDARRVAEHPERFRDDANRVLRLLFERIERENRDFYPQIESA